MTIPADAVVFDKGNVLLLDPFPKVMRLRVGEFVRKIANYHAAVPTKERIVDVWTEVNNSVHYPFCAHFTQEEGLVREVLSRLGLGGIGNLQEEFLETYREGLKQVIESDLRTDDVRRVLRYLQKKGKHLGVFSNDRQAGLEMELRFMRIDDLFEYICTSEKIGIEKPDSRVFSYIKQAFSPIPENRIVYVGDDPVRDIDPAKKAGFKTVLYQVDASQYHDIPWRAYKPGKETPDAVIKSFSELLDVIK